MILHGNNLEILAQMEDNSIDAIVTDPPYGLGREPDALEMLRDWLDAGHHDVKSKRGFMGKEWDAFVPQPLFWKECLRVLKPGGHLVAFAGTRTQDLMALGIRIAGFEVRDMLAWCYGSGFPKSANVSKMLDQQEKNKWMNVAKAIDNADRSAIFRAWKEYSKSAKDAGLRFQRNQTETGTNTPKSGSVLATVLLQTNPENSVAVAVLAELSLIEPQPSCEEFCNSALFRAGSNITELKSRATSVECQQENLGATTFLPTGIVPCGVREWQSESTAGNLKAVEALKTWLGSQKSSKRGDTSALCAALTGDLKVITLSAISVTIMESTAVSLISFMADTLKSKAIDKMAGAERCEGAREWCGGRRSGGISQGGSQAGSGARTIYDAPATPEAEKWDGWGTALKPALEPITLARKPLEGTVAENVLRHGTGGLNVDGCRVDAMGEKGIHTRATGTEDRQGRWPANFLHDGSAEVLEGFPETASGELSPHHKRGQNLTCYGKDNGACPSRNFGGDSGSAARYFYCAKASKREREEGLQGINLKAIHPTVKPVALMRWLCRLITPPGGTILDPFMGSGTTGIAAKLEGFDFIGIEREAEYHAIAEARISAWRKYQENPKKAKAAKAKPKPKAQPAPAKAKPARKPRRRKEAGLMVQLDLFQ